ncbi:hypothetical protein JCM1841_006859 [Sporobolomyces salmonicolor]
MENKHPKEYDAALFPKAGEPLEIRRVKWVDPAQGEVVIKVLACGVNATDYISQRHLIDDEAQRFPVTPSQVVVGDIEAVGGDSEWKRGDRVGAIMRNGGMQQYCPVDDRELVKLDKEIDPVEAVVLVFNGSKLAQSYKNNVLAKEDLVVLHGIGGYARLGIDLYKQAFGHANIALVTTDRKSSAVDYGLQEEQFLRVGERDIGSALRKMGRARCVICVDPPEHQCGDLIKGCLDDARFVLLTPAERTLQIPLGELVQRGISFGGSPYVAPAVVSETVRLAREHGVQVNVDRFPFTETGVRAAWDQMDREKSWKAPVVQFGEQERD